nr:serine kinase [bacterium]
MRMDELAQLLEGRVACPGAREITGGIVGDLLSHIMAHGQSGQAWVTVQKHINVIAIAVLHDMAAIVLPEGLLPEPEALEKAKAEGVGIILSPLPAFVCCGRLYRAFDNREHRGA